MTIEHKEMKFDVKLGDFDLKASEGGGFTWEGYVAAFDNVDSYGDVIEKGAFADEVGGTIPAYFEHAIPVGKMFIAGEDPYGLRVKGELAPDSAQDPRVGNLSERLRWLMAENKNVGELTFKMSIGFYPVEFEYEKRDGQTLRVLKKIKLAEGSLVLNPANEKAVITDFKGKEETLTTERLEAMTARELEAALKSGVPMSGTVSKKMVSLLKVEKSKDLERLANMFAQ
jgi:uncharacterized protein